MTDPMTEPMTTRAGFAALIGAPNAGKSTLTNALVGQKVSIVTRKIQTTRFAIRGVAMHHGAQIILVDTPGVFAPRSRFDRAMVSAAWGGAADADVIVHVVDAAAEWRVAYDEAQSGDRPSIEDRKRVADGLRQSGRQAILALNKIDELRKDALLELASMLGEPSLYSYVFMISARQHDGIGDLKDKLAATMPAGPYLYPEDQVADLPMRLMAAEVTREALFDRLHQELPYASTVETESWQERKDGSVRIEQTIYVERDSQRKIALGKDGTTIKAIGQRSRKVLETMLERQVHLFLFVKIREGWREDRARYNALGLDYDA
jgi:GTPase